jgi:hypothetical protein
MLFYITGGAPQAVPGTACVEANRTACTEDPCSSGCWWRWELGGEWGKWGYYGALKNTSIWEGLCHAFSLPPISDRLV